MAGWAGHAGGGTDVRANRIFPGGGGLTERQRHEEGERKSVRVNVRFNTSNVRSILGNKTFPDVHC